jgi:hypothetical protein
MTAQKLIGTRGPAMEMRSCVECGAEFRVNYRAGPRHLRCGERVCQRKRLTKAQRALRAERAETETRKRAESPGFGIESERAKRAKSMREYRATHGKYCERDAVRRRRSRERRNDDGSTIEPVKAYVQAGPSGPIRLRVVTEGGVAWRVDGVRLTEESARDVAGAVMTTGEGIAGTTLGRVGGVVRRNDDGMDGRVATE